MVNCLVCDTPQESRKLPNCRCQWERPEEFYAAHDLVDLQKKVRTGLIETIPPAYLNYIGTDLPESLVASNPAAVVFLKENFRVGSLVYLRGETGRGKTHLGLWAVARLVRDLNLTGAYVNEQAYFEGLEQRINNDPAYIPRDLTLPQVLLYDDFGRRKGSAWVLEKIYGLLEYRSSHGLATIVTSNFTAAKAVSRLSSDVDDAAALVSRLDSGREFVIAGIQDGRKGSAI